MDRGVAPADRHLPVGWVYPGRAQSTGTARHGLRDREKVRAGTRGSWCVQVLPELISYYSALFCTALLQANNVQSKAYVHRS